MSPLQSKLKTTTAPCSSSAGLGAAAVAACQHKVRQLHRCAADVARDGQHVPGGARVRRSAAMPRAGRPAAGPAHAGRSRRRRRRWDRRSQHRHLPGEAASVRRRRGSERSATPAADLVARPAHPGATIVLGAMDRAVDIRGGHGGVDCPRRYAGHVSQRGAQTRAASPSGRAIAEGDIRRRSVRSAGHVVEKPEGLRQPIPLGVSLRRSETLTLVRLANGTKLSGRAAGLTGSQMSAREIDSAMAYAPKDFVGVNGRGDRSARQLMDSQFVRLEWMPKKETRLTPPPPAPRSEQPSRRRRSNCSSPTARHADEARRGFPEERRHRIRPAYPAARRQCRPCAGRAGPRRDLRSALPGGAGGSRFHT